MPQEYAVLPGAALSQGCGALQERSWLGRGGGGGLGGSFSKSSKLNGASAQGGAGSKSNGTSSNRDLPREQPGSRFRERIPSREGKISSVFESFRSALGLDA